MAQDSAPLPIPHQFVIHAAEGVSLITVISSLIGALPPIATALAIVWYLVMIIEAVMKWRERRERARLPADIE